MHRNAFPALYPSPTAPAILIILIPVNERHDEIWPTFYDRPQLSHRPRRSDDFPEGAFEASPAILQRQLIFKEIETKISKAVFRKAWLVAISCCWLFSRFNIMPHAGIVEPYLDKSEQKA
jgi:hypothetical protein